MKQKPGREMPEFCRNREADVLRFASDTPLWPTSNTSERGVRPPESTAEDQRAPDQRRRHPELPRHPGHLDIGKHGPSALEAPEQFILGHPRMPPAQLISP